MNKKQKHVRELLEQWRTEKKQETFDQLYASSYEELRALARSIRSKKGIVNTTSLVHALYLKWVGSTTLSLEDERELFRFASKAMKQIVIDFVRHDRAQKRIDRHILVSLTDATGQVQEVTLDPDLLIDLYNALEKLTLINPLYAEVIDLHIFSGFTYKKIGEMLGVDESTVRKEYFQRAMGYLRTEMDIPLPD